MRFYSLAPFLANAWPRWPDPFLPLPRGRWAVILVVPRQSGPARIFTGGDTVDRPLAALALLLGVIALALTAVGMGETGPLGPGLRGSGATAIDDLASGIDRVDSEFDVLEKDRSAVSGDIDQLAGDLAEIRKGSSVDRAAIGRLVEEALRAKGLKFKGDPAPKPEKKAEPPAAAPKDAAAKAKLAAAEAAKLKAVAAMEADKKKAEAKEAAKAKAAKKAAAARKPNPLERLHGDQRKALIGIGLDEAKADRVVESLEGGRKMTLKALREHSADKKALTEARQKIDARVDGQVKTFLEEKEYDAYLKWRKRPVVAPRNAAAVHDGEVPEAPKKVDF